MFYGVIDLKLRRLKSAYPDSCLLQKNGLVILGRAQLTNKDELKVLIGDDKDLDDLSLLADLYSCLGMALLGKIKGSFAFLILDGDRLWGARDHFGVFPFYYAREGDLLHFSDSPIEIKNQLSNEVSLNDDWLWQYLNYAQMPWDQSLYQEIKRLPPAREVSFSLTKVEVKTYWSLSDVPAVRDLSEVEIKEKFQTLLFRAIEARLPSEEVLACELSGGLDSSTVAAFAKQLRPDLTIKAFTHISKNQSNEDERDLVQELCKKFKIESYLVDDNDKSFVDLVKQSLKKFPYPSCNLHYMAGNLYEKARDEGCRVLLSGFGGDEAVTSYSSTMHCRELIRRGSWLKAFNQLRSFGHSFKGILKHWNAAFVYRAPEPLEPNPYLEKKSREAVNVGYDKFLKNSRDFSIYRLTELTYLSERLENSYHQAEAYGLEYRYPLLDVDLVGFYTSLPTEMKCRSGVTRYLIREATVGVLPDSIRLRDNKDVPTLPAYVELMKSSLGMLPEMDSNLVDVPQFKEFLERLSHWQQDDFFEDLDYFEQVIIYQLYLEGLK